MNKKDILIRLAEIIYDMKKYDLEDEESTALAKAEVLFDDITNDKPLSLVGKNQQNISGTNYGYKIQDHVIQ
jgi:hypothetical protein